jgi:hypothetical protein
VLILYSLLEFVKLIKNKTKMHLTEEGLLQIINLRASINLGLSNLHKSNFPNYKPVAALARGL